MEWEEREDLGPAVLLTSAEMAGRLDHHILNGLIVSYRFQSEDEKGLAKRNIGVSIIRPRRFGGTESPDSTQQGPSRHHSWRPKSILAVSMATHIVEEDRMGRKTAS